MLTRREVLRAVGTLDDALIVCHLADAANDLYEVSDSPSNFYMLGSMGMAIPFALGLALGTKQKIVAIEGDGGCLMNLGVLTTVARYAPENLAVLVLDNQSYASTGGQPTASAEGLDFCAIAEACGISAVARFATTALEIPSWVRGTRARFGVAEVAGGRSNAAFVPLTPTDIAGRFSNELFRAQQPPSGAPSPPPSRDVIPA